MQYRGLKVRVQAGQVTVRQVWRGNISTGNATGYNASEAVSWAGGGTGVFVFENGSIIEFYRTGGPIPAVGNAILGTVTGASRTIGGFPAENLTLSAPVCNYPALFSTTGGTQGPLIASDDFFIEGQGRYTVTATNMSADTFEITPAWAGPTLTNVDAVVNRDKTSNFGLPLVKQGFRLPFTVLEEAMRQIDALLASAGGVTPTPPAYVSLAAGFVNNWGNLGAPEAPLSYAHATIIDSVILKGYIQRSTGSAAAGEDIIAAGVNGLPSGKRPSERLRIFCGEWISIETDGSIKFRGLAGPPGPVSLNGIIFRADGT